MTYTRVETNIIEGSNVYYFGMKLPKSQFANGVRLHLCDKNGTHIEGFFFLSLYDGGIHLDHDIGIHFACYRSIMNKIDLGESFKLKVVGVDDFE